MPPDTSHESLDSSPTRLRVGLFGAGLVGQAGHAPSLWEERERFDFVAVADASPSVRHSVAARYGVPHACATLEDALSLGLDAIVIAVPDPAHRGAVLTALDAGVHVFCEKPLALSLAECDEILAARGDLVVQCGYMKLYDPALQRMVERLTEGPVELVYLSVEVNDPDQAPFVDHLGLVVGRDVPQGLIDEMKDVTAPLPTVDAAYFDGGRGVSLSWTLPGDGRAHLEHLNLPGVADYRERVTAYCRDRILELTFPSPYLRHHPTRLVERHSDGTVAGLETIDHRVSYEEAFRNELRAFHAAITTGVPVRASVEAARDDLAALLDGFRLAVSRHRRVA